MKIDLYTKSILTMIAVALFLNVFVVLVTASKKTEAFSYHELYALQESLHGIKEAIKNHP